MNILRPDFAKLVGAFAFIAIVLFIAINKYQPAEGILANAKFAGLSVIPLLFFAYIKFLWRLPIARIGGLLCDMPDLNGRYEGIIDRKDARGPHPHAMEIRQDLLSISIRNFGEKSQSRGTGASIQYHGDDKTDCVLVYAFHGETKNHRKGGEVKKKTVVTRGETRLALIKRTKVPLAGLGAMLKRLFMPQPSEHDLQGSYVSDRTDTTAKVTGEISVRWVGHERKGSF